MKTTQDIVYIYLIIQHIISTQHRHDKTHGSCHTHINTHVLVCRSIGLFRGCTVARPWPRQLRRLTVKRKQTHTMRQLRGVHQYKITRSPFARAHTVYHPWHINSLFNTEYTQYVSAIIHAMHSKEQKKDTYFNRPVGKTVYEEKDYLDKNNTRIIMSVYSLGVIWKV